MKNLKKLSLKFLSVTAMVILMGNTKVYANNNTEYITNDNVNFRVTASTESESIDLLEKGTPVIVKEYVADGWSKAVYKDKEGYVFTEFISTPAEYEKNKTPELELLTWTEAKQVFTTGVDATVYDVRTGLTYKVRSFSNGHHADVEPVTKEDTATMLKTYGGSWSWDTRPIWVTINGRTLAASINGMPHGGGVNNSNGMDGQVCIHFKGSTTHNGNKSHERDHQNSIAEAWNAK